jgi:hypothetical protein
MRSLHISALLLTLSACAPVVQVTDGELDGELGAVSGLMEDTRASSRPGTYAGQTTVELDVEAADGRRLMLLVDLPEAFARRVEPGDELPQGTFEGDQRPKVRVTARGCSREQQRQGWDLDIAADGVLTRIASTEMAGIRRAYVTADFEVEGELQTLQGWFDYEAP